MKIRKGFVSNSSSSSFLVFKPAKDITKTEEEKIKEFELFLIEEFSYNLDDKWDIEDLEHKIKAIKEKDIDITRYNIVSKSIEHGAEDDIMEILHEFEIPYIEFD